MRFSGLFIVFWAMCCASVTLACDGREITSDRVFAAPICIPATPQRIVVMDHSFALGIGLELGLPVVGAPLARMSDKTLADAAQAAGVTDTGFVAQPNLETIVALQPDLILAFTGDVGLAETYQPLLAQLAPTVIDVSGDWRGFYDVLTELAGTSAAQDHADASRAAYETRLAEIKSQMPARPVSIVRITTWDFQVYTDAPDTYAPFEIAHEAGLLRSAYETAPDGPVLKRPDWEELARLDGETLLYIVGGTNDSDSNGRFDEVVANPLWQRLPGVASGRVYPVDPAVWMEFSGYPSALRVLDDLERLVINAP